MALLLVFILHLLSAAGSSLGMIPAVIVFGDSSVDAGNNNQISTILKSNFSPYGRDFPGGLSTGRFCNGRIPPDFISEALGLKPIIPAYLDPSYNISHFATGVCFASAGTGYDNQTSNVLSVIPLWKELESYREYQRKLRDYLGRGKANEVIGEALYLISMGTNDFLENYYLLPERSTRFTVVQFQDFLVGIAENLVRELYGMGARKISLGGVPPMGCLPLERTTNFQNGRGCVQNYNNVASVFNGKLRVSVHRLRRELPGVRLLFTDVYNIFLHIIRNPSLYGFEEVEIACCGTGMFEMGYICDRHSPFTCSDANKFVFWDAFHPTEKTNRIITNHLMSTSPIKSW